MGVVGPILINNINEEDQIDESDLVSEAGAVAAAEEDNVMAGRTETRET